MVEQNVDLLRLSPTEERLSAIIGPALVAGGRYILEKHPEVLSDLTTIRPRLVVSHVSTPTGPRSVPYKTAGKPRGDDIHRNISIQEAISQAPPIAWARTPDLKTFTANAALHNIPIRDYEEENLVEGDQPQLTPEFVTDLQRQSMRYLLVDESLSMAGGGDILAMIVSVAFLIDCGNKNTPLYIRHFNKPRTNQEVPEAQMTKMETPLDLEQTADVAIHNYNPKGLTAIADGIIQALADVSKEPLVEKDGREIVLVTDCEILIDEDGPDKINQAMKLAKDLGVCVKVIYLQDKNIRPLGAAALEMAGCQMVNIPLDEIQNLPEKTKKFALDRTKIELNEEEVIQLKEVVDKTYNILTYLVASAATYITAGGSALYLSKGINPVAPGVNIPPWHEGLPSAELALLLGLEAGLQALTLLLLFRQRVLAYIKTLIDVPEIVRRAQEINLRRQEEQMIITRHLEEGTEIIWNGERRVIQFSDMLTTDDGLGLYFGFR